MKLKLVSGSDLEVSEATFGQKFNETLVHQVVTAYRAAGRAGTKRQKSRAEVRGVGPVGAPAGGRGPFGEERCAFDHKPGRKPEIARTASG